MFMKTQISLRLKIVILLIAGTMSTVFSTLILNRLDQVVNGDLYRYGLQFNYEWAGQYWAYTRLILGFLGFAMVTTGIAMIFVIIRVRTARARETEPTNTISCLLLVIGIAMTGLSAFFFNRLDYVVHNDLYRYGLHFSYEWASQYWTYAKSMLGLLGLSIATSSVSIVLILLGEIETKTRPFPDAYAAPKISSTRLVCLILFFFGSVALAFSINFSSSILAYIGLGLIFWCAILLYIQSEEYIKKILFDKTTLQLLTVLDQIILGLGYKGKGIYLPPKYLRDFESNKVFIGAQEGTKLPLPEQIQIEKDKVILKNPEGILITPLGAQLTKLFEERLGVDFTKVDLQFLEQNLAKLLVANLEIAQNFQMEIKNNKVHVKITNSIYQNVCKKAKMLSNIDNSLGCPLCSAIACTLAKATGKPIIIEKKQVEDGHAIDIEYLLLE